MRIFITVFLLLTYGLNVSAQLTFKAENSSQKRLIVRDESKQVFKFPWAGGMNALF